MTRLGDIVGGLAVTGILLLAAVMLVPAALGLQRYVITTGSMAGTIDPGSIIFDEVVQPADLRTGDIITYNPPPASELPGIVTHRIVAIDRTADGRPLITTKGDANEAADTVPFVAERAVGRVRFDVPHLGHAYAALNTREGRLLVFGIPGALIALLTLIGLWRDAGEGVRREREAQEAVA